MSAAGWRGLLLARASEPPTLRELLYWCVGAMLLSLFLHGVELGSTVEFINSVASLNLIIWFACLVVLHRITDSNTSRPATAGEMAAAGVCALALLVSSLLGFRPCLGVVVTAAGGYLVLRSRGDESLRAAGIVLMAIAFHLVWGRLLFEVFLADLLWADAALVRGLLALTRPEIAASGGTFYAPDGHVVSLVGACSSFRNVSLAMLASVAAIMCLRTRWRATDIAWIGAICATMVAANTVRIGVLAMGTDYYQFWHEDIGVQIIALIQTGLIGGLSYLVASRGSAAR